MTCKYTREKLELGRFAIPSISFPARSSNPLANTYSPVADDATHTRSNALVDSHAASAGKPTVLPSVST